MCSFGKRDRSSFVQAASSPGRAQTITVGPAPERVAPTRRGGQVLANLAEERCALGAVGLVQTVLEGRLEEIGRPARERGAEERRPSGGEGGVGVRARSPAAQLSIRPSGRAPPG